MSFIKKLPGDFLNLKSIKVKNLDAVNLDINNSGSDTILGVSSDSTAALNLYSDLTKSTFTSANNTFSKNESTSIYSYIWKSTPDVQTNRWYAGVSKDQMIEGTTDVIKYTIGTGNKISNSKLVIDRAGNVGIGTTDPTSKLQVNGDVTAASFSGSFLGTFSGAFSTENDKLTSNSDTSFLTARIQPYNLSNGNVLGLKKTIILNNPKPESFIELLDNTNNIHGVATSVHSISYDSNNNDIYVSGNITYFRDANGGLLLTPLLRRIVKFSLQTSTWSVLNDTTAAGVNNIIEASEIINGRLFLGGEFTGIVDENNSLVNQSEGFAEYNISLGRFQHYNAPFGTSNRTVRAMTTLNSFLYIGGDMSVNASGGQFSKVVKFDPSTDQFSRTTTPDDIYFTAGSVYALTNDSIQKVYAGGQNTMKIGSTTNAHGVAVFDDVDSTWSTLSGNSTSGTNLGIGPGIVRALALYNNILYVAGEFTTLENGLSVNNIATFDTVNSVWSSVPNSGVLDDRVRALEVVNGKIVISGDFTNKFYVYDPTDNSFFASNQFTFNNNLYSLKTIGNDVYVGGNFFSSNGSGIVKYGTLYSATINGLLYENGGEITTKTLNLIGEKLNLDWNGTHWII
jgi:hypothetical protein